MTQMDMHTPATGSKDVGGVTPFQFEGRNVRLIDVDGETWFFASDIAAELAYDHVPHLLRYLDEDERGVHPMDTLGGRQEVSLISEAGVYRAIIQRRATKKVDEKIRKRISRFQRWVFHDVLPSIRKTGSYSTAGNGITAHDLIANPHQLLAITQGYALQIEDMKREKAAMQTEVDTLHRISDADDIFGIRVTAKLLQMQEKKFTAWVQRIGWAYRQPGTKSLLCYAEKQKAGYVLNKVTPYTKPDGTEGLRETLKFTPKGVVRLGKMLNITLTEGDLFARTRVDA